MAQGYKGFEQINREATQRLKQMEEENELVEERTDSLPLLKGGKWFKDNPGKILGEPYETTDQYSKTVTRIRGTMDDVIQGIDIPSVDIPHEPTEALESEINEPLEQLIQDDVAEENVDRIIKQTKKKHSKRELNKLYDEKKEIEESYLSFEQVVKQYNKGISDEEIKAWIWYKRKNQGFNDETTILKKTNGWSKYVVPLAQADKHLSKWLKQGIVCYFQGSYMPSVLYFALNIYEKQSQLLREKDTIIERFGQDQYDRQWNGLEKVKPIPLTLADPQKENRLFIKPTSDFAKEIYVEHLADGTKIPTTYHVTGGQTAGKPLLEAFADWISTVPKDEFKKSSDWDIKYYYLAGQTPPRYYDKEEKLRIRQNAKIEGDQFFVQFLAEGISRDDQIKIEREWNRKYNGYMEVNYFKVPIGFTCSSTFKNKPLFIRPAQREGIGFISVHGSGCIAYDVGVGKTMTAILCLAQALDGGQCKRPFIVVPNQTYKNWLSEIRGVVDKGQVKLTGVLPQYQVIDLYNLSQDHIDQLRDDDGNIAQVPEFSISVLTYEGFNRLGFNDNTWSDIGDELYGILNQGLEAERDQVKLYEKIEEMMGKGLKGGLVNIEELGFDYMVVDEAHAMKKSFTQVKGQMQEDGKKRARAPYEIKSGTPSMTALRGFMVSQYILRNNNWRNILLLTATPFTNSPLEIYSVLALIGYHQLRKFNITNIKEFFDLFIKTSLELVINAKMKPERKEIVLGFNNLIALQQLIFNFINYKTGEDANIQRPNKIVLPLMNEREGNMVIPLPREEQISTNLSMTPTQKEFMRDVELYVTGKTSLRHFCVNPMGALDVVEGESAGEALNESNLSLEEEEGARVLRGLSFARQLALSPYLYACNPDKKPTYKQYIETSPKLKYVMECIRSVKSFHEQRNEEVSGQVIYMNAGVHFFPLIKDYLVREIGIKEKEVGMIRSGMSAAKKEGIKERFLSGEVKLIIGSATIKEGINLQNRATTLYNCWLDWNPTDVKQLEGRIWRFGNQYANVRIVNPLIEDSIDTFIFQKIEEKTSRINEIWYRAGKVNALSLEEFNPAELKMGLVTDPNALAELLLMDERENIQDEINGLNNQKTVLEEIKKARDTFNQHIEEIKKTVHGYKPQKEGAKARAIETIFKIYKDYLEDENTETTYREENIYDLVRKANATLKRGLEQVLEPKGFDINFNYESVVGKIDKEIEEKTKILDVRTGDEAVDIKAKEIIQERIDSGYKPKSVADRVKEFAKLNDKVLTEMMVYPGSATKEKQAKRLQRGRALEESADTIQEMEQLMEAMEEMKSLLNEMELLKAA